MAKKKTKRRKCEPLVSLRFERPLEFELSKELHKEPEALRRLGHRAVDLLVDAGHYERLSRSTAGNLAHVADDLVIEHMTELLQEVRAEGKEAARG